MNIFPYEMLRITVLFIVFLLIILWIYLWKRNSFVENKTKLVLAIGIILFLGIGTFAGKGLTGRLSMPLFGDAKGPFEYGPELPMLSIAKFFGQQGAFPRVSDIAWDPSDIPAPIFRNTSEHLTYHIDVSEVIAEIDPGITYNYWTFNGKVPGPLIRARVGDTITIDVTNSMDNLHHHTIDFHAVTGPGGGAKALHVDPGETKSLTFKALNPGLYIYHCASADSVAVHMAHGQYGLILIEPEEGMPPVDKEFYVVQGELYTRGDIGDKGLAAFDGEKMLDELPTYVVFNGKIGGINGKMNALVGDKIRIFFGNGGVAKISSFHIIGEIFDNVYPEAAIGSDVHKNVQSVLVPAGGATIVEFDLEVPGDYILVDHALARMDRGAWGKLHVDGAQNEEIFSPGKSDESNSAHMGH